MHSLTSALILGMAAAATAKSSQSNVLKRDTQCILDTVTGATSADQVKDSINQWLSDVNIVNSFLNDVGSGVLTAGPDLSNIASTVFISAADEPCELGTLSTVIDFEGGSVTDAFDCAVADLERVFEEHVLDNLQTIIDNSNSTSIVQAAVDDINAFRCCNVLPDASILWLDTADDSGISDQVQTCAPRPNACASISCVESCNLDNSVFGSAASSC